MRSSRISVWRVTALFPVMLFVYILSYLLLMDRNRPTGHGTTYTTEVKDGTHSSFRWAPETRIKGQVQHGVPDDTVWNVLFAPLDKFYYTIFPTSELVE